MSYALFVLALAAPQVTPNPGTPRPVFTPRVELHDFPYTFQMSDRGTRVGQRYVMSVWETTMGSDLNGDGDAGDRVLHAFDLVTGAATNFEVCGESSVAFDAAHPDHALAEVSEGLQGNQDLNGDGDHTDFVFFDLDLSDGSTRNSGLASSSYAKRMNGPWAAFMVRESSQNADLDGDGSLTGNVLFSWNLAAAGAPASTALDIVAIQAAHQGYFLFTIREIEYGADSNGDGDVFDTVVFSYRPSTGAIINTGLAGAARAQGQHSVITVAENQQGVDLNGDGDLSDSVPHVFDLATGELDNLQVGLSVPRYVPGHGLEYTARDMDLGDEAVAFHVSEPGEGNVDLNGDEDALDDDVLFVHRFATGETRNLQRSVWNFELEGDVLVMQIVDAAATFPLQVHELSANTTWDPGVRGPFAFHRPGKSWVMRRNWIAMAVYEDGVDETGDGRGDGHQLVLAEVGQHGLVETHLSLNQGEQVTSDLTFNDSGALTVLVDEFGMAQDLDGDGDIGMFDQVVHVPFPGLGVQLNTGASGRYLFAGPRQVHPFLAFEQDDGTDHNGDGDASDHVLRTVRIRQH